MLTVPSAVNSAAVTANMPAEAICEEKDVRISSGRGRQGSKIVNADGYSKAIRQRDGEGRPSNGLTGGFLCLALEAASYPPFGADFHTYPPIETFQHFECSCDTEVARSLGVACVHDPWSGLERHINANGIVEGRSAPAAVMAIRRRVGGDWFPNE